MRFIAIGLILAISAAIDSNVALAQGCTVTCAANVPESARVSTAVAFQAAATRCGCAGSAVYQWTFGDGNSSTEQNPTYTYMSTGTYNWSLTVTSDSVSCMRQGTIQIHGGTAAPLAGTYQGTTSQSGGPVFRFVVNSSGQITSFTIGYSCPGVSGQSTVSTTCSITNGAFTCGTRSCSPFLFSFSATGSFSSSTATGTLGFSFTPNQFSSCCQVSNLTWTATLTPQPLGATASANQLAGNPPLDVSFTGAATGGSGSYTYSWDFGDCTAVSTQQNPSHTYAAAGRFFAILTANDGTSSVTAAPLLIIAGLPGDANGDSVRDITDIVYLLNHLFAQGPAPIVTSDVNADGLLTISDIFYLINHLFVGGPAPL